MSAIVVNTTAHETRVAVLENHETVELHIERHRDYGLVGNIYQGRVTKILPGMQAAFVDIGLPKAGFLHATDTVDGRPEPLPTPAATVTLSAPAAMLPAPSPPPIEETLEAGQDLLVQVIKEPLGTKGHRLTAVCTLAGRYLVLMPHTPHIGISRRITSLTERERLEHCMQALLPTGMGCIIRTLGEGGTLSVLEKELQFLLALWQHIQHMATVTSAPCLIHQESDLLLRTIRDLLSPEIDSFLIDHPEAYARAQAFIRTAYPPDLVSRVRLHEGTEPIFTAWGVEQAITRALRRKVWLKSGGYITIDTTEALVAIDVNTGRFVGGREPTDTILQTNLEAAHEISRQLRLRNMGGLIVIDFIDMIAESHKAQVLQTLEAGVQHDRAYTRVLPISEFGLVEMTRKRVRASLQDLLCEPCEVCQGTGVRESVVTVGAKVFRESHYVMQHTPHTKKLLIHVSPAVAEMLQHDERDHVLAFEQSWGITLIIKEDGDMPHGHFEVLAC